MFFVDAENATIDTNIIVLLPFVLIKDILMFLCNGSWVAVILDFGD